MTTEKENEQEVAGQPRFAYYENLYQLVSNRKLTMQEVYGLITGTRLRHITGEIRRNITEGNPEKARFLKKSLPCITFSCDFPTERRTEQAGDYTGYVLIDADHLTIPASEYQRRCEAFPFVVLAHVSASGSGVHLAIHVDSPKERHADACRSLQDFFETQLEQPVDRGCTDLTRAPLLCYAPDCYYNPDATAWHTPKPSAPVPIMPPRPVSPVMPGASNGFNGGLSLSAYLDVADRSLAWVKGQRHSNLVSLAFTLNRAGFDERDTINECLRRYISDGFGEQEVRKIITSAYQKGRAEHGCNRKEWPVSAPLMAESAESAASVVQDDELEVNNLYNIRLEQAQKATTCFPEEVYGALPECISDLFTEGLSQVERSVVLLGSLNICSAMMVHVRGSYEDNTVEPPFYFCLMGAAASGKGILGRLRRLYQPYAEAIRRKSAKEVKVYENLYKQYQAAETQALRKGTQLPDEPEKVEQKELELSGNITRARLVEYLSVNDDYAAFLAETEIDVINVNERAEHGQLRDVFNRAFQHEPISKDTKKDKRFAQLYPRLAIQLSGTLQQVVRFLQTTEDGLFSRFLFFYISEPSKWKPLTNRDNRPQASNHYREQGQRLKEIALHLEMSPTWVNYTDAQRDYINERFPEELERLRVFTNEDLAALVFRLGLIHFRICMVLTALRKGEQRLMTEELSISDTDFFTAMRIVFHCLDHTLVVSTLLKENETVKTISNPRVSEQLLAGLTEKFTFQDALKIGEKLGISKRTIQDYLSRWLQKGILTRVLRGFYQVNSLKHTKKKK